MKLSSARTVPIAMSYTEYDLKSTMSELGKSGRRISISLVQANGCILTKSTHTVFC